MRFEWVRGHGSDPINNRADELALMGANGRLLADGAMPEKKERRRSSKNDDYVVESELTMLLKPNESIGECAGCGQKFVSRRAGDDYCSLILCQVQARGDFTK